jgi:phage major head subunit gpT-like protein
MANSKVDIFTAAMRTEFLTAFDAVAEPAPWEAFTARIPSTARIENYAWMSPVPAVAQYYGRRRLGNIAEIKYSVANLEYDAAFQVLLRDIEDDQVGAYKLKPQELAQKAKIFPGRLVLSQLALGAVTPCFDGSNFFAATHTIGTGANIINFTSTGTSDAQTHNLVVLIHSGPLKPLVYQDRKNPNFQTDSGTPQSQFAKEVRYWIDMEGAAAYGYWWDAVLVRITNTPNITDLQNVLGQVENLFRTFTLPSGLSGDLAEYVHEQHVFTERSTTLLVSGKLSNLARQVITQSVIIQGGGPVTNIYQGWATPVTSNFLNTVS